jgi:hypothetical protein
LFIDHGGMVAPTGVRTGTRRSPESTFQYQLDRFVVFDPNSRKGSGKARLGREARIGVNFQNPRLPLVVDAKVDPRVTAQVKYSPAVHGQLLKTAQQRPIGLRKIESPRRVVEFE